MTYQLPDDLWPPQRRGIEQVIASLEAGRHVCLQGPTGSGKTRQAIELFKWARSQGMSGSFYANRRLLIGQTSTRFTEAGLPHGIRAAEYEDCYSWYDPFQIISADTEWSRAYERHRWRLHGSNLVVVDEAHLQRGKKMSRIIKDHKARGAKIVLLTATPLGLSGMVDELIISGSLAEYRECKAIVPAHVYGISQPDMSKIERNKTGEYILDGKRKAVYTQTIVGEVIAKWREHNPEERPTLLYAPGKAESVWFASQFEQAGVPWCHVDATDTVLRGKRYKLTRPLWDEILQAYKAGEIKGLSSRFKLREGVDIPQTYCCILATPIGSMASYIQTVGRVLRYSPQTPDGVVVCDHGGNFWRMGSPNSERPWRDWWYLNEAVVSRSYTESVRNGDTPEPIRCPKCDGERTGGFRCPHCGFEHAKSQRHVRMESGEVKLLDGELVPRKYIREKPDSAELWKRQFWAWRKNKVPKTFAQMRAWFAHEHHYWPPTTLPLMPTRIADWNKHVHTVKFEDLQH